MNAKKPEEIMDDSEFRNSVKNGNRMDALRTFLYLRHPNTKTADLSSDAFMEASIYVDNMQDKIAKENRK